MQSVHTQSETISYLLAQASTGLEIPKIRSSIVKRSIFVIGI
jgi:hypothetical protein